jgi:WD40 repeat protein
MALFPGFTRAVWSPDGTSALLEKRGFGTGEIYLWTATKGVSSRPIVTARSPWGGVGNATWSPDGKRFAYLAFDPGNIAFGQIYEADADGSNQKPLFDIKNAILALSWGRTPAGDRIAIETGCGDDEATYNYPRICLFDPDAPDRPGVPVPGDFSKSSDVSGFVSSVDWSPDGSGKLLVSAHPTVKGDCGGNPCQGGTVCDRVTTVCYINGDIFVVDAQSGGYSNLTNSKGWPGPYEAQALWSPDGTQIAYLAAGPKSWTSVWVANYTGGHISNPRMVSPPRPWDVTYDDSPTWQPCRTSDRKVCTMQAFGSTAGTSTTTGSGAQCNASLKLSVVISAPGHKRPSPQPCWGPIVKIPPAAKPGCNVSTDGRYWAWNEIQSPRGSTSASDVLACAKAHPSAQGVLYYAGDSSIPSYWSTDWAAPAGLGVQWRFLELYGCNAVPCHDDIVTGNMLERWLPLASRFAAMLNVGGGQSPEDDDTVAAKLRQACKATRSGTIGLWWGTKENDVITASRMSAITQALNDCMSSS